MPLLPGLQPLADALGARPLELPTGSVAEARAALHEMSLIGVELLQVEVEPVAEEWDATVVVAGGEIVVRVYRPSSATGLPAYVFLHGGGWWSGSLDLVDPTCRQIARDVGCVVVSVDYRLAPEHTFPTPLEDCYAAVCWTVDHARELGIDRDRLAIGGESAGGNLAAAVALLLRDRGGPAIVLQVLEIPATDLRMVQPSLEENADGPMLSAEEIRRCVSLYLSDPADAQDPYASPLLADSLVGLPPALVMTAEYDPIRDDGEAYAQRLTDAGVATRLVRWDGQFHGSAAMAKLIPDEAADYHQQRVDALGAAFASVPTT